MLHSGHPALPPNILHSEHRIKDRKAYLKSAVHRYPPALIRTRDRIKYISSLEKAQLGGSNVDYNRVIYDAANRSLDIYLNAVTGKEQKQLSKQPEIKFLRIGQLAKQAGESNAKIR